MGSGKLKKILKGVENALAAASFAEEGEAAAARSLYQNGRCVLLGLKEGQVDAKTLRYALNTAKRVGAQLHILYVSTTGRKSTDDSVLGKYLTELTATGIPCRVIDQSGCLKQRILEYTNAEKDILFAVIESPTSLDADCNKKDKALSELWQKLKCPLVVVMDTARAT